ncbi:MAG: guanylate kinase [Abditibacteriales bacterium]|nr:guanylate kinase [Abditibacteriales bacterium]MDW8367106.1 guanylate kinase [Abditibacteriales bacterium]
MEKEATHPSGRLFVISGPAGVGKDTLLARVLPEFPHLVKAITTTTRPRKEGEVHGRDYFFVTVEEFQQMIDSGQLLEWAKVHERYYGSPKQWVEEQLAQGRSVVLVIDVQGGLNVKALFPDAVLIFIRPPRGREREVLLARIAGRGRDSAEEVQVRLKTAEWELSQADRYDYQIVNEDLEEATQQLKAIIQREVAGRG